MEWLSKNWESIAAVIAGLHVLAIAIVNLTPTPKDNDLVSKIYTWIEKVAGLFGRKVKE